ANHYPWVRLTTKLEVRSLKVNNVGYFDLEELKKIVDNDTGLVVLSHALFNTGAILPVEQIGNILAEKNIPYFIDAAQTVGCLEGKIAYKEMPAKFQAAFRNWDGIAGVEASIVYLLRLGLENIRKKNLKLANLMREELSRIPGVILYGPEEQEKRTSIVSFSLLNQDPKIVVERLEKQNMILAVREIFTQKVIRASMHFFNTESQIFKVVEAIKKS